jgi:hypothetical protein
MPGGKPAGVRCVQLTEDNRCAIFGMPERPVVCVGLQASEEMCGGTDGEALRYLEHLELATMPVEIAIPRGYTSNGVVSSSSIVSSSSSDGLRREVTS